MGRLAAILFAVVGGCLIAPPLSASAQTPPPGQHEGDWVDLHHASSASTVRISIPDRADDMRFVLGPPNLGGTWGIYVDGVQVGVVAGGHYPIVVDDLGGHRGTPMMVEFRTLSGNGGTFNYDIQGRDVFTPCVLEPCTPQPPHWAGGGNSLIRFPWQFSDLMDSIGNFIATPIIKGLIYFMVALLLVWVSLLALAKMGATLRRAVTSRIHKQSKGQGAIMGKMADDTPTPLFHIEGINEDGSMKEPGYDYDYDRPVVMSIPGGGLGGSRRPPSGRRGNGGYAD